MANEKGGCSTLISSLFAIALLFAGMVSAYGQSEDEQAVKGLVESFLVAVGDGDLKALPDMFVSNANIGTASFRDGSWVSSTMTFGEWLEMLNAQATWTRFQEPVTEFTVHVEDSQMAFVRAVATVFVEEQARSHNVDYFTLVRENGAWKFLSASYTAKPVVSD